MKYIKQFENIDKAIQKNFEPKVRLVELKYNGEWIKGIAISYAASGYYMQKYYLLNETPFENDFEEIKELTPVDLLLNK